MDGLVPGRIVWYQTDERNGLSYFLPAIVTVTQSSHPGDYPGGEHNPLPAPSSDSHVHLTVFTPGGFGTRVGRAENGIPGPGEWINPDDAPEPSEVFVGADKLLPGSGTYVELDVPHDENGGPRSWRWPDRDE